MLECVVSKFIQLAVILHPCIGRIHSRPVLGPDLSKLIGDAKISIYLDRANGFPKISSCAMHPKLVARLSRA